PGAVGGGFAGHVLPGDDDLAGGGDHIARKNAEHGRFAGTVRPDDGDEGALIHGQADLVQDLFFKRSAATEDDIEIGKFDHADAPPRRRRGNIRAKVTRRAVAMLRSDACKPNADPLESANWMAMR